VLQKVLQTETYKVPHTYQRNGIYYLRYRVPKAIQEMTGLPAVIRQSLQTTSPEAAKKLTNIVVSKICELKGVVMAKNLETSLKMHFSTIETIYGKVVIHDKNDVVEAQKTRAFMIENQDIIVKNHDVMHQSQAGPHKVEFEVDLSLSDAMAKYMTWRVNFRNLDGSLGFSDSAKKSRMRNFALFLEVIGDIDINKVTKFNVREVLDVIRNMPRCNKAPYTLWTLEDAIRAARSRMVPECDLVASKQAKEALKDYQSLFSRFLTVEKGLLKESPTKGVKVDFESISYAVLSGSQMASVVDYWKDQPCSDYKWIILLAVYTGARRGDIFNLKISSVRHDKDCERFFLFIEEGKTDAARRKIPLHIKLIELGFLNFYKAKKSGTAPEDKLFREFKSDQYITLKFRESLDYLDVPRANDALRRYSFHSLRHAVITEAAKHNNIQLVQRVVGHEITGVGITKLYTGEFELKDVLNVVDCLSW
jgi:integrase